MTEEKKHYTEQTLATLLDNLIEADRRADLAQGMTNTYARQAPTPPPSGFPDVRSLVEYHDRAIEHERELKARVDKQQETYQERARIASELKAILPKGLHVDHTYHGDQEEYNGRYAIHHRPDETILISRYHRQGTWS